MEDIGKERKAEKLKERRKKTEKRMKGIRQPEEGMGKDIKRGKKVGKIEDREEKKGEARERRKNEGREGE